MNIFPLSNVNTSLVVVQDNKLAHIVDSYQLLRLNSCFFFLIFVRVVIRWCVEHDMRGEFVVPPARLAIELRCAVVAEIPTWVNLMPWSRFGRFNDLCLIAHILQLSTAKWINCVGKCPSNRLEQRWKIACLVSLCQCPQHRKLALAWKWCARVPATAGLGNHPYRVYRAYHRIWMSWWTLQAHRHRHHKLRRHQLIMASGMVLYFRASR